MALINGEDALHQVNFPYTLYNKIKNHWRGAAAPGNIQPGMIWSDEDDDKLYHHGVADDEILQLTNSADVSPLFTTIKLSGLTDGYVPYHIDDATGLANSPIFTDGTNVGIGTAAPGAKLEVEVADANNVHGVLIDFKETGDYNALLIDSESTTYAAIQAYGKYVLRLTPDISGGYAIEAKRDIAEAGSQPLVNFIDDNAANTQTTLRVQQDGTGDILNLFDGATKVFTVLNGGNVGIGLTPTVNMVGLSIEAGCLTLKERATPTADVNYGKIYTKNDDLLYFQDGAGVEHQVAYA